MLTGLNKNYMIIKIEVILLITGITIYPVYSNTYQVKINSIVHKIDLEKLFGIKWVLIPLPESFGDIAYGSFFGMNEGVLLKKNNGLILWKYVQGRWKKNSFNIRVDENYKFFAESMNNLWINVHTPIPYKSNLINLKGKRYKEYSTQNTAGIEDLWFNEDGTGWAACEWGQLLYFDGKQWKQKYCPVTNHVNHIIMYSKNYGVASTDKPFQLLKYENNRWSVFNGGNPDFLQVLPLLTGINNEGRVDQYIGSSSFLKENLNVKTDIDTLYLQRGSSSVIFVHKYKQVLFKGGYLLRDIKTSGQNEVILIVQIRKQLLKNNYVYNEYGLFTKNGLKKRIVIVKPYVPDKIKYHFKFKNNEFSGAFQHGMCISDMTGDGFENMYAVVIRGVNRLYDFSELKITPKFKDIPDIAEKIGAGGPTKTKVKSRENYDEGVSSADIDNDGDQDIFVTSLYDHNFLFKQRKSGKFKENSALLGISQKAVKSTSGIWADINNDGFVDLFVSNQNAPSTLYLNNGAGFFEDITDSSGINTKKAVWGSVFGDIDGDGDPDLFVPRRGSANMLFVNQSNTDSVSSIRFSEQAALRGVTGCDTIAHSTSGVFADIDNDGDLDLYVTNLTCSNWLYLNDGRGFFTDVTESAGLIDSSLSQTSVIFDADNDGDLDIYAGNRGESKYFSNSGNGKFIDKTEEANAEFFGWVSGLAVGDLDKNGFLELYISDDLKSGRWLRSSIDTTSKYIRIHLKGTLSNRDAIGAKIFLYKTGFINDKNHLLGMREINGGSGFNSMNSRIAHFGLPGYIKADAYIRFPSGIEKKVYNLKYGQKYIIYEQNGLARHLSYLNKFIKRTVKSPKHQNEALFLLLVLFILININYVLIRQAWWQWRMVAFTFVVPLFIFLLFYLIFYDVSHTLSHIISSGLGALFCFAGTAYSFEVLAEKNNNIEMLEKLFLSSNSFFHGEWGARKLNRIQLYCTNLEPGSVPDKEMKQNLAEAIKDFYTLILPEVEIILSYADSVFNENDIQNGIRKNLLRLSRFLNQISVDIELAGPDKVLLDSVLKENQMLQNRLKILRKSITKYFSCNVFEVISSVIKDTEKIVLTYNASDTLIARIRPAEFSQIIENMIDNSLRAMSSRNVCPVRINVDANADYIFVNIKDCGCGIEKEIKSQLFSRQVSTKKEKGGFGLFNAKQILEKYGGSIMLVKSIPNEITEFEIHLKRIDNV